MEWKIKELLTESLAITSAMRLSYSSDKEGVNTREISIGLAGIIHLNDHAR